MRSWGAAGRQCWGDQSAYRKLAEASPDSNNNDPKSGASEINSANDHRRRGQAQAVRSRRDRRRWQAALRAFPVATRAAAGGKVPVPWFRRWRPAAGGGFEDILNSMFGGARGGVPAVAGLLNSKRRHRGRSRSGVAMTGVAGGAVNGGEKRARLPTGKELMSDSIWRRPAADPAEGAGRNRAGPPAWRSLITVSIAPHALFWVMVRSRLDLPIALLSGAGRQGSGADAWQRGGAVDPEKYVQRPSLSPQGQGLAQGGGDR